MNFRSDEIRNASGTFTFSSPEDYEARRPLTFTQRRGDPTVQYSMFQGAWFFQDDIRLRKGLAIGFGLRHEWQTHLPEIWNLAPRAGFSWSPFANGRTTVRGGVGIFHDWYGASTYEETVQVDGTRVEDLTIRFPDFPDPLLADAAIVLPRGRVQASPTLEMTTVRQATIALERRLGRDVRVNVNYTFRDGVDLLRGRDVNAPGPTGVRPDPSIGNVIEIQSIGQEREHEISTALSGRLPFRRLFLSGRYSWDNHRNDGDGALSLPADNNNPDEWGPARGDVRHRFTALSSLDLPANVQLGVNVRAESAPPYNITTGHDDNGDTVFNDRPAGVGRNTARAEGLFRLDLRLSWRVGANQSGGRSEGRSELAQRTGGSERARRPDSRIRGELYIRVTNLLNSVTGSGYSGVMTSPFFGLPRAAQAARRAEVGTRISF